MMRLFRKNKAISQFTAREEPAENRQDMEINPNPSRDFSQPAHQNPTPKGKQRPFFGRVGALFRRLFRRRKKKKKVVKDPEEINTIPSAITKDNVNVSEKKTETTSRTESALQQTAEELEFTPSAEVVAAPIDGLQLSIPNEVMSIPPSGTESTHAAAGELEFPRAIETVAEPEDWIVISIPTEAVPIPGTVIDIPSLTKECDSEDTPQSSNSSDIVESTTTTERDPSSDTTYFSTSELEFTTAGEAVAMLKEWRESSIPTEIVPIPDTLIKIPPSKSNKSDSEDTTQFTDSSYIAESTLTDEIETTIVKNVVKLTDGMSLCICPETVSVGRGLQMNWKINIVLNTGTTSTSSGSQIIIPDRTCACEDVTNSTTSKESDQPTQQISTPVGNGQSFFSKAWGFLSEKEEREGENEVREGEKKEKEEREGDKEEREGERGYKEETSLKEVSQNRSDAPISFKVSQIQPDVPISFEVSQIQSDVNAPLTPESFNYHKIIGHGAYGKVLVASHPSVDQLLAIKIAKIPSGPPERIFVERQAMEATGGSRFFPHLFATFHTEYFLCYVMEFVNGGTLQQFIHKRKSLDIDTIRFIAAELQCGLQLLHSRGIVHNDLHLENILIDNTGHVKIIDFGIASLTKILYTQSFTSSEVIQKIPRVYFYDYLFFNNLLMEMKEITTGDYTQLQEFIWKISTFPDPQSSFTNLRHHPFFTGINWDELEAGRMMSPYAMEPSKGINRSSKIDVKSVMDIYTCVKFAEIANDQEFDFVSDRWREMQQHH